MQGTVLCGINNVFTVLSERLRYECRLKGKTLDTETAEYNPLAAGDSVNFEPISLNPPQGLITSRLPRKNAFIRFNKKLSKPQTIAANFDILAAVTCVREPPFRPRFLDRVFVSAPENCERWLICNKTDFPVTEEERRRLRGFESIGIKLFFVSVKENRGIEAVRNAIDGRRLFLVGQSGVGKSSLLNVLRPDADRRVASVSQKYNRGRHTTNYSLLFPEENDLPEIIDSPGIREIEVYGIDPADLRFHFPDFAPFSERCGINGCRHISEPRCAVRDAVENGELDNDRWLSYFNLYGQLERRCGSGQ